jgi:hypothetical protein
LFREGEMRMDADTTRSAPIERYDDLLYATGS